MKIYQIDSSARKKGSTSRALAKKLLGWEPTQRIEDWVPIYKKEIGLEIFDREIYG